MRSLVVEDDRASWKLLQHILQNYGPSDVAMNGRDAIDAFTLAHDGGLPYDVICLDVMMPVMDGMEALKAIRRLERQRGILPNNEVKIFMTTALDSPRDLMEAFYEGGCTGYLVKPLERSRLLELLKENGLVAEC